MFNTSMRILRFWTVLTILCVILLLQLGGKVINAQSETVLPSTIPIPRDLMQAYAEAIINRPSDVLPGEEIIITSLDTKDGWAISTVAAIPESFDEGESLLANSTLVLAQYSSGGWSAAIMGSFAYESLLAQTPESFISRNSKTYLRSPKYEMAFEPEGIGSSLKWPWRNGQTWQYFTGRHGTNNSAIDLAPYHVIPANDRAVVAAASGTIVRKCDDDVQSNVAIRHSTGGSNDDVTGYLHVDKNTVSKGTGSPINQGETIGTTYNAAITYDPKRCGYSEGPHVHFSTGIIPAGSNSGGSITLIDIAGTTVSGWNLGIDDCFSKSGQKPRCVKEDFTSDNNGTGQTGDIFGFVKNATNGSAISGATVTFSSSSNSTTTTDGNGRYSFSGRPAGGATISASKTGYASKTINVTVNANATVQAPDINLSDQVCTSVSTSNTDLAAAACGQWHAEYYPNSNWSGSSQCPEDFDGPNFSKDWQNGSPCGSIPSDNFTGRFTGTFNFSGGTTYFHVNHDDGAILSIDGNVLQNWSGSGDDCPGTNLSAGNHAIQIDYREDGGGAHISLDVRTSNCNQGGQWHARYYSDQNWNNQQCERDFGGNGIIGADFAEDWGNNAPTTNCSNIPSDNFSVRYTGTFNFSGGAYWFHVNHDDGAKLIIDGNTLQDWSGSGDDCPRQDLGSGNHSLQIDYRENGGGAHISLEVRTSDCVHPPSANFDASPQSGPAPLTVAMHIVDTSNISSCSWDYGDGQTGTSCASSHDHVYSSAGTYSVRLDVSGPGGSDSMTRTNYITVTDNNTPPADPANLRVTGTTLNSVSMAWDNVERETGFYIYKWGYDANLATWTFIFYAAVGADVTTYTDSGLICGSDYFYEVSAINSYGESELPPWVMGTTLACPQVPNDAIESATVIGSNSYATNQDTTIGTTAGTDPVYPCGSQSVGSASVWYRFTPNSTGLLDINTNGSDYDTMLAVWRDNHGTLVNVACDDDGGDGLNSRVSGVYLYKDVAYYLEVVRYTPGLAPNAKDAELAGDPRRPHPLPEGAGGAENALSLPEAGGGTLALALQFTPTAQRLNKMVDFDGDGRSDIGLFRPSTRVWYVLRSSNGWGSGYAVQWGLNGDIPFTGDFDGDGRADKGIYRASNTTWYILKSTANYGGWIGIRYGLASDLPVLGDYDGDGKTDLALFRPSTRVWYILRSSNGYTSGFTIQWGIAGDKPVVGDFDGDGRTDIAVFRPGNATWYILRSSLNYSIPYAVKYGLGSDRLMPGDYDGDGRTDIALYRESTRVWYILQSSSNNTSRFAVQWGLVGDKPVAGDFDGDGLSDLVQFRPGNTTWYILKSTTNYGSWTGVRYGSTSDLLLPQ